MVCIVVVTHTHTYRLSIRLFFSISYVLFVLLLLFVECGKLLWCARDVQWIEHLDILPMLHTHTAQHWRRLLYWCPIWFDCCHYQNHFYFCLFFSVVVVLFSRVNLFYTKHTHSLCVHASLLFPSNLYLVVFLLIFLKNVNLRSLSDLHCIRERERERESERASDCM